LRNEPEISNDYVQRLNRVVDHVLAHLTEPLSLEAVAHEAGFSPFHFHRIFHSMLGETLHQFVRRLRLERALKRKSFEPDRTLTDIALECGFGSSSDFSRSFKKVYGVPPSQFDVDLWRTSKRDAWRQAVDGPGTNRFEHLPKEANPDGFVAEVRELPPRIVAYIRVIDSYRPDAVAGAYERLMAWADARGFGDGQWLGYMWDDPDIVPHEKCRYDAAVVLPESETSLEADGEVGRLRFPAMTVGECEIRGTLDVESRAIDWMFRTWLPRSGFVPSDQPCFEVWNGRPFAHGVEHFEIAMHLPVEPATPFGR
tara:strand:+ start:1570 stop:2505 length:936 start_codon:yes stop_codon:yes gene_type:complete